MFLHAAHASQEGYETFLRKFPDVDTDVEVPAVYYIRKISDSPILATGRENKRVSLISMVYLRNTEKIPVKHCLVCTHLQGVKV